MIARIPRWRVRPRNDPHRHHDLPLQAAAEAEGAEAGGDHRPGGRDQKEKPPHGVRPEAAAEVGGGRVGNQSDLRRAGDIQPSTPPGKSSTPANDDRKSAIVTTTEKTAQHQREQQQMAKLMASEQVPETKDLVDRMMLGRWPGNGPPKKPGEVHLMADWTAVYLRCGSDCRIFPTTGPLASSRLPMGGRSSMPRLASGWNPGSSTEPCARCWGVSPQG